MKWKKIGSNPFWDSYNHEECYDHYVYEIPSCRYFLSVVGRTARTRGAMWWKVSHRSEILMRGENFCCLPGQLEWNPNDDMWPKNLSMSILMGM